MSIVSATANTLRHIAFSALPGAKLSRLRALGRPHGVEWLRAVYADNGVSRLSQLPRLKIDALIAGLERNAIEKDA